jgi:glyceraldehyde-3-phosphate dehydrogenase/erythrose-4-phosphate dehydrogenase
MKKMAVFEKASETTMKGVLGFTEDLVVSQDFVDSELQSLMLMRWIDSTFKIKSSLGMIMNMDT